MALLNLNHHKLTRGEETIAATREFCVDLMVGVTQDPNLLYEIVAGGITLFRLQFADTARQAGVAVTDQIAEAIFRYFRWRVRKQYRSDMDAQRLASIALDHTVQERPLTEKEAIQSLEVDSSSCDDARREMYGRDGSPQKTLEILKDELIAEIGKEKA